MLRREAEAQNLGHQDSRVACDGTGSKSPSRSLAPVFVLPVETVFDRSESVDLLLSFFACAKSDESKEDLMSFEEGYRCEWPTGFPPFIENANGSRCAMDVAVVVTLLC